MKRFTLLFLLVMFAGAVFSQTVNVTFNVDFKPYIGSGHDLGFDAENDTVYLSGEPFGWAEPGTDLNAMMTDADDDSVYTLSVDLDANTSYAYKYFYVPASMESSWDYGDWLGDPNRSFTTGSTDTTINEAFGALNTLFLVKDAQNDTAINNATLKVGEQMVTTDMNGKAWAKLLHDSSHVYSISAEGGYQTYIDTVDIEKTSDTVNVAMEYNMITFKVDMKEYLDTSSTGEYFDPTTDTLYITGSLTNPEWTDPGTNEDYMMTDANSDSIYDITLAVSPGDIQYKYFYVPGGESSSWDYGEWVGDPNRELTIPNNSITINNVWGKLNYNLTFHVTDQDNKAIEMAQVAVDGNTYETDTAGYTVLNLLDGEYDYTVTKEGYLDEAGSVTLTKDDTVEVSMTAIFEVKFNVADTEGSAIDSAVVTLGDSSMATNASGVGSIMMTAGDYDYTITKQGYVDATGSISVVDTAVVVNDTLAMMEYTVTFNVTDTAGNAVSGAEININDELITADDQGAATIDLVNGTYDYVVSATGYIEASGSVTVADAATSVDVELTEMETAIDNPLAKQFSVYPNPSQGNITLQGEELKGAQVSVLNTIGNNVKQFRLNDNTNRISLDNLKPGIYFIKIEKDKHEIVRKIIIK